jgi:peptide/nickel transport system substrate-binding protein
MLTKIRMRMALALVVIAAMVLAVVPAANTAQAQSKTLVVGFTQEPDTMNGFYSAMAFGQWAFDLVTATMWDYDDKGLPVLVLAAEVPTVANGGISEDLMTYTLKLKPDLKWSDGEALDSDDVVFTYQMIMEKKNNFTQATAIQEKLTGIEKIDATTVKLTLNAAEPFAENLASNLALVGVLPQHVFGPIFEAAGTLETADPNQNPTVFSGPYVLTEWIRGESLTFTANANYANGAPGIETVVIRIFPDTDTANAALAAGDIAFLPNVPQADPVKLKSLSPDIEVVTVFGGYIENLWINARSDDANGAGHPALRDVNVRKAIRLAINRRQIVDELLGGSTNVSDSIYANSPFENKNLAFVEFDAEAAKKMLDEAGWVMGADNVREKDGVKFILRMNSTTAGWRQANLAVIQQNLADVGIKTELAGFPASEYFGQFNNGGILAVGNFDMGEWANNTVLTNILNVTVNESMGCAQLVGPDNAGGNNYLGFCNEEMDALMKITMTSTDAAEAQAAADKIQEIVYNELPVIVLFPRGDIYGYNKSAFAEAPRIGSGVGNQWFDIGNWKLN